MTAFLQWYPDLGNLSDRRSLGEPSHPQLESPCTYLRTTFDRHELTPARYQAKSVSDHYSTIGYLIPIMSLLVVPILPRARFLQNLLVTCVCCSWMASPKWLLTNCILVADLFRGGHIAPLHVDRHQGEEKYDPYFGRRTKQWTRTACPGRYLQCGCQCLLSSMVFLLALGLQYVSVPWVAPSLIETEL